MAHAFISYSHQDDEFVNRLSRDLQMAGVVLWRDTSHILPGQNWVSEIGRALSPAAAIIFVVSRASIRSIWTQQEIQFAASKGNIPIYPIIIDDLAINDIPAFIRHIQWIDFRDDYQAALGALLAALPASVRSGTQQQVEPPKTKGYVFISFAEPDSEFAARIRGFLTDKGYAFWDYQSSDRNYHIALHLELEEAITGAAATLSILSPDWKRSKWAPKEYIFSEEVGKPVFLLMARRMGPTLVIAGMPYIDFAEDEHAGFEKLDRELRRKGLI